MPPQEREAHREKIAIAIEIALDGYWRDDMSDGKRALILADWCDELEDWPVDSVKAALRQWRRENPNKKPNPGHIIQILKRAWGERNAAQVRAAVSSINPQPQGMTPEQHAELLADLEQQFPGIIKKTPEVKE